MLFGDVESNPGPADLELMVAEIFEGKKSMANDIKERNVKQNQLQSTLDDMDRRIDCLENLLVKVQKN